MTKIYILLQKIFSKIFYKFKNIFMEKLPNMWSKPNGNVTQVLPKSWCTTFLEESSIFYIFLQLTYY